MGGASRWPILKTGLCSRLSAAERREWMKTGSILSSSRSVSRPLHPVRSDRAGDITARTAAHHGRLSGPATVTVNGRGRVCLSTTVEWTGCVQPMI